MVLFLIFIFFLDKNFCSLQNRKEFNISSNSPFNIFGKLSLDKNAKISLNLILNKLKKNNLSILYNLNCIDLLNGEVKTNNKNIDEINNFKDKFFKKIEELKNSCIKGNCFLKIKLEFEDKLKKNGLFYNLKDLCIKNFIFIEIFLKDNYKINKKLERICEIDKSILYNFFKMNEEYKFLFEQIKNFKNKKKTIIIVKKK